MDKKIGWAMSGVLLCCLASSGRAQQATTAAARQMEMLKPLLPLPAGAEREIMNPYHAKSAWKLWAEDPSPVTIKKPRFEGTFEPPASAKRTYPTFPETWKTGMPPLEAQDEPAVAGFWDDCYMSLDNYHTRLRHPAGQFIVGGKMSRGNDPDSRFKLGVTFTSQSYSARGRHIIDDTLSNLDTERHFFFANCIRATPSHISYQDTGPDKVTDLYDALFGNSYHSVGQSGSEMHGLYKMMMAGGCMPRQTKNLLKTHGAYASALLTLFKAALPYSDASGNELPYEHELRHRPSYSSHGTPQHAHYCYANVHYHGYDDDLHIRRMVNMARGMTSNSHFDRRPSRLRDLGRVI